MDTEHYFIFQNNYRTNYRFIPHKGAHTNRHATYIRPTSTSKFWI